MRTNNRISGNVYAKPMADIKLFDIEDVLRTSGEVETLEVGGNYAETGWDSMLKGGLE